ncbi:MAG: transposase family protein [Pseudonocardia sp.]|nr:transposase family protein [Pseudonocardia sp.]
MWRDPATGRRRAVWAFVMVLPYSRHLFVRPTLVMDQAEWTAAHVEAFAYFGGIPARLVPDNLKTGVERPDLYDPKINRSYAELASHYDTLVDPARAAKPRTSRRWNGRCPMFGTRSGGAGSSARSPGCALRRCAGAARSPGPARVARWRAPHGGGVRRGRGPGVAAVAGRAVRVGHLVLGPGRARHPRQGRGDALPAALAVLG